jgi:hypothetical protein
MPDQPATQPAPQNLESFALQTAPAIGRGIVTQWGIGGLLFVLLVGVLLWTGWYAMATLIPAHIKAINDGRAADVQADIAAREKQWQEFKAESAAERADHRANLQAEREQNAKNIDNLAGRIERGFDRLKDRAALVPDNIGDTATAKVGPGG